MTLDVADRSVVGRSLIMKDWPPITELIYMDG